VKARAVKHVDPSAPLADGLQRIIRVRLDELHSFLPDALEPTGSQAMHDMRIAAKRLRYLLELSAFCFGQYARTAAKRMKELQDLLGEVHDCDVMLPLVLGEVAELRALDAAAVVGAAAGAQDVGPAMVRAAPHASTYRGLELYAAYLQARRALLFARFASTWHDLARRGFRGGLEHALAERPGPASSALHSASANGVGAGDASEQVVAPAGV